jgi:uncharacterized protein YecT (DUF1311 family)
MRTMDFIKIKILISLSAILFLSINFCYCQNKNTLDSLGNKYQSCLDKGEFMSECSQNYYFQMDSLLNVVYTNLKQNLDSTSKVLLKKEQKEWLVKRNKYFNKNQTKTPKHGFVPQDYILRMYDLYADFVKERVLFLIGKLGNQKK